MSFLPNDLSLQHHRANPSLNLTDNPPFGRLVNLACCVECRAILHWCRANHDMRRMIPRHVTFQTTLADSGYNVTVAPLEAEDRGKMEGVGQGWGLLE
jgi:hypothetical protein